MEKTRQIRRDIVRFPSARSRKQAIRCAMTTTPKTGYKIFNLGYNKRNAIRELLMETIDVKDLPELLAQAIETMVHGLQEQVANEEGKSTQPTILPKWRGKALGTLSRDEMSTRV